MTLKEKLNQSPREVKTGIGSDGKEYQYVPASVVKDTLDDIFDCDWDFEFKREYFGKNEVTGTGILSVTYDGALLIRSGSAALPYERDMRLEYPLLATRVLMNAAKSLGRVFGRDLNQEKEDDPDPAPKVTETIDIGDYSKVKDNIKNL